MLLFSTMLNINDTLTKEDFVKLVIKWNQESPHSSNVIPNIVWNGEMNIRYGNDDRWLDINEYRNQNIIAVRYEKTDDEGLVWDTDYIMNFNEMRMSIQLDRSFRENAIDINADYSTPHFISLLIDGGYLNHDNNLQLLAKPHLIYDRNLYLIANVIRGREKYQFPVVYVSKTIDNDYPVDIFKLSKKLRGIAHVIVQTERSLNGKLKKICDGKNDRNGAIGIYYPASSLAPRRYYYRVSEGYDDLLYNKVTREVIRYVSAQRLEPLYTWSGVNASLLYDRYTSQKEEKEQAETAKKAAEDEKEAVYKTFGGELKELNEKIQKLNKEITALRTENQGLRAKLMENGTEPILFAGDEKEFFPGEVKEMVLIALEEINKAGTYDGTRKGDLIKDIIRNNFTQHNISARRDRIKSMLNTYKGLDKTLRQKLQDFGFQITEDGKHYKLTYYGDNRYVITLSKTPSDHRSGKNTVSEIIKKIL